MWKIHITQTQTKMLIKMMKMHLFDYNYSDSIYEVAAAAIAAAIAATVVAVY